VCCTSFSGWGISFLSVARIIDNTSIDERPLRNGAIIGWITL
jgi:hypothetical protein